jgi:hypothetical protein
MAQKLDNIYLAIAIDQLSKYFSLTTPQQTAGAVALQDIQGFTGRYPNETLKPDRDIQLLMDLIINTNYGTVPISDLLVAINKFAASNNNATT